VKTRVNGRFLVNPTIRWRELAALGMVLYAGRSKDSLPVVLRARRWLHDGVIQLPPCFGIGIRPPATAAPSASPPSKSSVKVDMVPSLFVINARGASLQGQTLTLARVSPTSIVFCRPAGESRRAPADRFRSRRPHEERWYLHRIARRSSPASAARSMPRRCG
jgi:hypothetical protein